MPTSRAPFDAADRVGHQKSGEIEMSALNLNERGDPSNVLYYAPRRARTGKDESTILPVLERLRRGEAADRTHTLIVRDAPALDPSAAPLVLTSFDPFALIGRIAVAAGIAGGLGLVAVSLYHPKASDRAPTRTVAVPEAAASALPHKVHTVSFQAVKVAAAAPAVAETSAAAVDDPQPASAGADTADDLAAESVDEGSLALTAPLKLWAMVPPNQQTAAAPPFADGPAAADLTEPPSEQDAPEPPPAAPQKAADKPHQARHAVHRRHATHHRHHRTRGAQTAAASDRKPDETAETQSGWTQPTDPLSNALRAIFANPAPKPDTNPAQ
jgi:hypothetical protein